MKNRRNEIIGILLILISVLVLLSLVYHNPTEEPSVSPHIAITNPMGIVGVYISHYLIKFTLGYVTFIFPLLGIIWGWWIFSRRSLKQLTRLSLFILLLALLTSIAIGLPFVIKGITGISSYHYSGLVGGVLANLLHDFLGTIGTVLILFSGALILIRGYFRWSYYKPFKEIAEKWIVIKEKRAQKNLLKKKEREKKKHTKILLSQLQQKRSEKIMPEKDKSIKKRTFPEVPSVILPDEEKERLQRLDKPDDSELRKVEQSEMFGTGVPEDKGEKSLTDEGESSYTIGTEVIEEEVDLDSQTQSAPRREYRLPSVELLDAKADVFIPSTSHEELVETANFLVQSLRTFGVDGRVVNISPGPIITLFEVEPAEGVRVNKFVQLSDDLARVMMAQRVRIIAPIPGKSTVGIEIPNKNPSIVYFKGVINSEKFINSASKLTIALGKTTSGENYIINLNEMPHLLIAGTTGSGKSVCINTIIMSILYQATPEEVRFILIDPKKLELAAYRDLEKYHLITTHDIDEYVITTPENVILALHSVEREMSRRYNVLADAVVRNIEEYHRKCEKDSQLKTMPYIVIIIDELADLMLRAPKEVEVPIARLTQMARAVGIHLVVATQRPSVDVITGVIKANFPARIAFQVATKVDSRTIIDGNGAEKLIGKGDMLFLPPGSSSPIRLHNSFVSLDEINRIVDYITTQPTPEELKLEGARIQISGEGEFDLETKGEDKLFREAVNLVITHQQGSISLLQRRLKVGYSRAARLIDEMEEAGIVGPFTGSKARDVLVDEMYLLGLGDDEP